MRAPPPLVALAAALAFSLGACAGGPARRTTTYTAADLIEASHKMAASLAASDLLADRTADSPPMRLGLGDLENRSNERLSDMDRRATVARVLISPPMLELLASKNASVVLPPARAEELQRFGVSDAQAAASYEEPTHLVDATFRSLTRTATLAPKRDKPADARKDYFLVDFVIAEADTRRAVWADTFEFARIAKGTLAD